MREAASAKGVPCLIVEVGVTEEWEKKYCQYAEFVLLQEGEEFLGVKPERFGHYYLMKVKRPPA